MDTPAESREKGPVARDRAAGTSIGVYVHVPFCLRRCPYCDFVSSVYAPHLYDRYCRALEVELGPCDGITVDSLYFGGGTPTVGGADGLEGLLRRVGGRLRLSPDCEVTVEANPETVSRDVAEVMDRRGVNRVSLGVQSFDEAGLAMLGRRHEARGVRDAVDVLRKHGRVESVSFDLIYGFPGHDRSVWSRTLDQAIALAPEHLSLYAFHVPSTGRWLAERPGCRPCDDDEQADMYEIGLETLDRAGYAQYELSNFARPGHASRHNQKYWRGDVTLGVGAGAASYDGTWRSRNTGRIDAYVRTTLRGGCPADYHERLGASSRIRERMMLALRLNRGFPREEVLALLDGGERDRITRILDDFRRAGLLVDEPARAALTARGRLLANEVMAELVTA